MQPIHFVTNRPRITGGFGPPPPCSVPETLSFGAALTLPATSPAQPGRLAGTPVLAGLVECSAPGLDLPLLADLQHWMSEAVAAAQMPVVVVPDRTAGFSESLVRTADLCARMGAGRAALAPVMFGWPSVGGGTGDDLRADRDRAVASAHAYGRFLRAFAGARASVGSPGCLYVAMGMGAVVSQAGGRVLDAEGAQGLPPDLFERAIVLGNAPDPALPEGGLDQLTRISTSVRIGDDLDAMLAPPKRRRRR